MQLTTRCRWRCSSASPTRRSPCGPTISTRPWRRAAASLRGRPVRLLGRPARLVPEYVTHDGTLRSSCAFAGRTGEERALDEALYIPARPQSGAARQPRAAPAASCRPSADEPPAPLLERFERVGRAARPAPEQRAPLVGALATRFQHLRETLAAHTPRPPGGAVGGVRSAPDDWLQIRVFAQSGARRGSRACRRRGRGAVRARARARLGAAHGRRCRVGRRPRSSTADTDETPPVDRRRRDPPSQRTPPQRPTRRRTRRVLDRGARSRDGRRRCSTGCATLPLAAGAARQRQRRAAVARSRRRLVDARQSPPHGELGEAWERRPPGVAFFGTERVRRLLGGGRAVTPRLRVEASGVDWFTVSARVGGRGHGSSPTPTSPRCAPRRRASSSSTPGGCGATSTASIDEIERAARRPRHRARRRRAARDGLAARRRRPGDARDARAPRRRRRDARAAGARCASGSPRFAGLPTVPLPRRRSPASCGRTSSTASTSSPTPSSLGLGAVLADDMGLGKTVQALAWLAAPARRIDPERRPEPGRLPGVGRAQLGARGRALRAGLRVLLLTSGETPPRAARRDRRRTTWSSPTTRCCAATSKSWRDVDAARRHPRRGAEHQEPRRRRDAAPRCELDAHASPRAHRHAAREPRPRPVEHLGVRQPGLPRQPRATFSARYDRARRAAARARAARRQLRPFLLRRTKRAVAPELPPRIEERRDCELTDGQRQLYLAELRRSRALVEALGDAPGGVARNKITILAALTRLRQICCHPALAGGDADARLGQVRRAVRAARAAARRGPQGAGVLAVRRAAEAARSAELQRARHRATTCSPAQTTKREQVVDGVPGRSASRACS